MEGVVGAGEPVVKGPPESAVSLIALAVASGNHALVEAARIHVSAVGPSRYIIKLVCSISLNPTPRQCSNPRNMASMEGIASMHLGTRYALYLFYFQHRAGNSGDNPQVR